MTILFFCEDAVIDKAGGVQNVTALWRTYFLSKGHQVHIIYRKNRTNLIPHIPQTKLPYESHFKSRVNIDFLAQYLTTNNIDVVINQAAQGPLVSYVCLEACRHAKTPLISIVHNSPDALLKRILNHRLFSLNRFIKSIAEFVLPFIIRNIPKFGTRRLVKYSAALVLLAPEYIEEYEHLYIGHNSNKLIALPNPINNNISGHTPGKENIALFVGRLCEQKAVDKILRIWKTVESQCDDAKLYIVGEGELRMELENLANELNLKQIYFEGYKDPKLYYERSKAFLMTSLYEGLPMTLLECQQYGVVPIVTDSFSAAKGILGESLSQFIIPQNNDAAFCNQIIELFKNWNYFNEASSLCLKNITRFSLDVIAPEFENLINQCVENNN